MSNYKLTSEEEFKKINNRISKASEENKTILEKCEKLVNDIDNKTITLLKYFIDDKQIKKFLNNQEIIMKFDFNSYKNYSEKHISMIEKFNNKIDENKNRCVFNVFIELFYNEIMKELIIEDNIKFIEDIEKYKELINLYLMHRSKINHNTLLVLNIASSYMKRYRKETEKETEKETVNSDLIKNLEKMFYIFETEDFLSQISSNIFNKIFVEIFIDYKFQNNILVFKIKKIYQENEDDKKEILDNFKPNSVRSLISINDKVTNELKRLEKDKEKEILNIRGYNNPYENEKIKVMLKNAKVKTSQIISPFDLMVLNSIYTLSKNNKTFDVAMIKKHLTQQDRKIKTKLDDDIKDSIEKMRITIVTLELTDYLNDSYFNPLSEEVKTGLKTGSYLLPIDNITIKKGGIEKTAYIFIKKPLYFEYVKMQNEFVTSDIKLLDVPITNNNDNLLIKTYIAKRVSDFIYQKKNNKKSYYKKNTINIETLFDELDLLKDDIKEKTYTIKRSRYIKTIRDILDDYQKKEIIKSYIENTGKKNNLKSITIIF